MSFAKDSKLEIIEQDIDDAANAQAFLSGLLHSAGTITKNSEGLRVDIVTDFKEVFERLNSIIKKLYGHSLVLEISDDYIINKTTYYRIKFPVDISMQVLKDCGMYSEEEGLNFTGEIDANIVADDETKRHFIKGAYVGCATSSIKLSQLGSQLPTTGYHVEFSSHHKIFLEGLEGLLNGFNITSRISSRKKIFVLYLKDSEAIKDLLALVGADESVMALADEMAKRELRNTVNRQVNCITANINKTVEASLKQINAIKYINKKIGLESLPEDLQEVAVLRLANPQESMEELLKLSTIELTKSGLNHRFRRILKIADFLREK
ncbi:MAG: DNA-binding protein WhiA [Clostridia bacterium]|nr:DNA-binding protein WhiA [Clostridia bacterium]